MVNDIQARVLDGACCLQMLAGGMACLKAHAEELNALNVFPVADGDTGTNMLRTMEEGLAEAGGLAGGDIGEVAGRFARGVLLGARGNSGVILSQMFAGIGEGLKGLAQADAAQLAQAYRQGVTKAYAAVQNPTEGTILTVFRESTRYAAQQMDEQATPADFLRLHLEQARRSLAQTKELLPVLAEADVVDSGAAGYVCIAEGMYAALMGEEQAVFSPSVPEARERVDIDSFTRDSVLEFGYCTELLLRLTVNKVDPDTFAVETVLSALEELGGESVVAYKQDDIVKVHVHTFEPGAVLARMQQFGEFLTVKVENMSLGHSGTQAKKKVPGKKYAVVAVASGEGMSALFTQMGADAIVSGGQTANPSAEEFLEAFRRCEGEHILVLPNNKNVIMAAKQAAQLYGDAQVHVVETGSLVQGYSALSVITPGIEDVQALADSALRAARSVKGGEVTRAVRSACVDGMAVARGEYMVIGEGRILAAAPTAEDAAMAFLAAAQAEDHEIITLFAGAEVTDDRRETLTRRIEERYEDCEVQVYLGGQPVYDYYLAVE